MIQRLLWLGIALEVAAYSVLYQWLPAHGWTMAEVFAAFVLFALALRGGIALPSFLLAACLRRRDRRIAPLRTSLQALAGECRARFISFAWSQPFHQYVLGRDPGGNGGGMPVVLVHGFACNRGVFVKLRRHLATAGVGPVFAVTLEPILGSIDAMARSLAAHIELVRQQTGQPKVFIVAHSMGGLVARVCLADGAQSGIAALVTLGSPHHGTELAPLGVIRCAQQMRRGSRWLAELAAREAALPHVPALSIYTLNDDLVYPPEASVLPWAENVPVSGHGHVALLFSAEIAERVAAFLRFTARAQAAR